VREFTGLKRVAPLNFDFFKQRGLTVSPASVRCVERAPVQLSRFNTLSALDPLMNRPYAGTFTEASTNKRPTIK
jgi:hypothetical protein